jgi:hypothetical protein
VIQKANAFDHLFPHNDLQRLHERIARDAPSTLETKIGELRYHYVMNEVVNRTIDEMVSRGVIAKNETETTEHGVQQKIIDASKAGPVDSAVALANLASLAQTRQRWATYRHVCASAVLSGLRAYAAVANSNFPIALSMLRSVQEHIAQYTLASTKLRHLSRGSGFRGANLFLQQANEELTPYACGTRVDWKRIISSNSLRSLDKKQLRYQKEENRASIEAKQILNAVDALEDAIRGSRGVYEILCEVAHPNIGHILLQRAVGEVEFDRNGLPWIEVRLGVGPAAFADAGSALLRQVYEFVVEMIAFFEERWTSDETVTEKIALATADSVRGYLSKNQFRLLVKDPYGRCFCGSERKIKHCCW